MKIKSKLLLIFVLCLVALFAVSLVACNHDDNGGSNDDPNDYETSTYTVTFNTDSKDMTSISTPVLRNVKYGSRISEPTDADGNKIIPYKRGYTFQYWTRNDTEFVFSRDTITENTTLKAFYLPIEYIHTAVLSKKYVFDRTETTVDPDTQEETTTDIYVVEERPAGEVVLPDVELDKATTTLKSIYASSGSKLPCPTSTVQNNKFCFWYYINKDGKPIQFSKWAEDDATTVSELTSYAFVSDDINDRTKGLELYPMFFNDLPKVTVKYMDADGETELFASKSYTFGQNVDHATTVGPIPEKPGYEFVEWYYEVEKTTNGVTTIEKNTFTFDNGGEKPAPTSPMDAAGAENNFKPVELVLKAKWIKQIVITSAADYKSLLYDELKPLVKRKDLSEEEQVKLDEILNASILIQATNGVINFNEISEPLEPLFDKAHPFKGTIDGLTKNGDNFISTQLTGGTFGDASSASVFGYNAGTIKNLEFKNIGLQITGDAPATVQIGVITTDNTGTIDSCIVTMDESFLIRDVHTVIFGGITAINQGVSSTSNGIIKYCTVNIVSFNVDCKALMFGAIAGESKVYTSIFNCKVDVEIESINCVDDGISSNGKSYLILGGMIGSNSGPIRLGEVVFNVKSATSLSEFVYGGVAGVNGGSIHTTYVTATLGNAEAPVSVSGSAQDTCIGGFIGTNTGYMLNCYATANLYVQVENAPKNASNLFVGGLVGSNHSAMTDSQDAVTDAGIGAINYSYSLGNISVKVKNGVKSVSVYVGGIAGRNSHKKVASLFSTVKINVTNDGKSYLGHIFGKMKDGVSTNGKIFYANESVINLVKDGKEYEISGDGKGSEEYVNFENIGEGTDAVNFKKADWLFGTQTTSSPIGFGEIWEVVGDQYPTFKDSIYDENKPAPTPDESDNSNSNND